MDWMQVFLHYVTLSGGRGNHKYILPIVVGQSVWILRSIHQKLMFWIDSYTLTNQLFASKLLFICRPIGYISKIHGHNKHVQYLGSAKKCHVSVPLVEVSSHGNCTSPMRLPLHSTNNFKLHCVTSY